MDGKTASTNIENLGKIIFVQVPAENDVIGSGTDYSEGKEPDSGIKDIFLFYAMFRGSDITDDDGKNYSQGNEDSVPSDV